MGENAKRFLELYIELETVARTVLGFKPGDSVVYKMQSLPQFKDVRDRLDYCREVRNVLQHHSKLDGEFIVEPSDAMVKCLENVLERLQNPVRAKDCCTHCEKMTQAHMDEPVLPLMKRMREHGHYNAPILRGGAVYGVFSEDTLFQYLLNNNANISETTRVSDFAEYLPIEKHRKAVFRFVEKDCPLSEIEDMFESAFRAATRIEMVFVTQNGLADGRVFGIITPWDVLGN